MIARFAGSCEALAPVNVAGMAAWVAAILFGAS
jgi:hypothetical protein